MNKEHALAYRQEHIDCGEDHISGSSGLIHTNDYESWLKKITDSQTEAPAGQVTSSIFFAFTGGKLVGMLQVRHKLNDFLFNANGHIGYSVAPGERKKGYATKMLRLALEKCRELGIGNVLVTCDKDNIPSAKTITKCSGVFENEFVEENGNIINRYWITV